MPRIRGSISYIVSKFYERPPDDGEEQSQDRSARITANATRGIAYFTIVLACVGLMQWHELRKQLDEVHAEQRPYIGLTNVQDRPKFNSSTGQVIWSWQYTNYGKSAAVDFKIRPFIKVGDGQYRRSYQASATLDSDQGSFGDVPPTRVNYSTVWSAPTFKEEDLTKFLAIDQAVGILVEMDYFDRYGAEYKDSFCLETLKTGAVASADPKNCEKQKH